MGFTQVKTFSFRNLYDQTVDLSGNTVFLTGENGQGKSNFLETVYVLCYGSSFRTRQDSFLIRKGMPDVTLFGRFSTSNEKNNTVSFNYKNKKKTIRLNGKNINDRKDIINTIPSIVFNHEDILFVNGTPDRKRWFFNQIMSMYNSSFIDVLRNYGKILQIRNTALKNGDIDIIDVLNIQLVNAGLEIQKRREKAVIEINETFKPIFREISGIKEDVYIKYKPSWKESSFEEVKILLENYINRDLSTGSTTSGPHRDRFEYYFDNFNYANIASTGQLRLISLVMRITQSLLYYEKTSRKPILLLDDVLLELDPERRSKFFNFLPEYEQAFFTFLPGDITFKRKYNTDVIHFEVKEGRLIRK